ncbi:MAG: hypothetical protein JW910_00670 [Anaerolineae bacterium]|nr:hypothetical protein [Anaerolineae bacterium]
MKRHILLLLTLALIDFSGVAPASHAQTNAPLPYAEHGPYAVGVRAVAIDREARSLAALVWYPALNPDDLPEAITYVRAEGEQSGHALLDAAPDLANGPYPLVVFAHGNGGWNSQAAYLTEHLASWGFVVMAADHPGSSFPAFAAGEGQIDALARRPLDVLAQIDYLDAAAAADEGPFAGLVDLESIAITGHSFGGNTALAAAGARLDFGAFNAWCDAPEQVTFDPARDPVLLAAPAPPGYEARICALRNTAEGFARARDLSTTPDGLWPATTDPRIRAVVAMAPSRWQLFGADGLAAITAPALVMVGTADSFAVPEYETYPIYQQVGSTHKALVAFVDGGHNFFVEACETFTMQFDPQYCSDPAWNMAAAHVLVRHFVTAFLQATLYGDATAAGMLVPDAVDVAGIQYAATF